MAGCDYRKQRGSEGVCQQMAHVAEIWWRLLTARFRQDCVCKCGNIHYDEAVQRLLLSGAANEPHQLNPPSEVAMATGVVLGVGLSVALVTLVFFLHSNATWSLHSLWQFIPQSARAKKSAQHVTAGTRRQTDISPLLFEHSCDLQMQLSDLCMLTVSQTNSSQMFERTGEGEYCGSGCRLFFFFFVCCKVQLAVCISQNHTPFHLLSAKHYHSLFSMTPSDIRSKIDMPKLNKWECSNYPCICSLVWWLPTTVIKNVER